MSLNQQHRNNITLLYCIIFYALMCFKWFSGLFLYQFKPILYNTRFDVFSWGLMQTGIHQWVMNNTAGQYLFDALFYNLPVIYLVISKQNLKVARYVALCMLLVNWLYIQCYTLYPTSSIESFVGWLLFPFLFATVQLRTCYYVLNWLRYFFLFFFVSAGLWKMVQMGVFNANQMSAILLYQHKEFLVSSPNYWLTNFFYWLIHHPTFSYMLYLAATLLELSFIVGFFTKKFDRWLLSAFIAFVILDLFIMRIYYWELAPFVITLLYSKYRRPAVVT